MTSPDPLSTPPSAGVADAAASARQRKQNQALFRVGLAGLTAFYVYFGLTTEVADPFHLYLGLAIAVLAVLPSLLWAKQARYNLPLFEVFMLTSINTYAIPLLSGHDELTRFDASTMTNAAWQVLCYLVVANITYFAVSARPRRGPFWEEEIVSKQISRFLNYGMLLATTYTIIAQFTDWIPFEMAGVLRAISFGVGNIACFLQSRRWGRGELPGQEKVYFAAQVFAQIYFGWASLLLIGGISLLTLCLLGYLSGAKKLPLIAMAIVAPILALLHNGKAAMRLQYWGPMGTERRQVTISELPQFYLNWINFGLRPREEESSKSNNARLLERTSLFHVMCLVVSLTPERQPFLDGRTYKDIPAQFVPRLFWREKPGAHVSTNTLAVYYGLQREEDTAKTTVGFGLLTEAYANYGLIGAGLLGFIFAGAFKKISGWSVESPLLSYPGLLMVVLMAWSFMTEFTLSIWLSSLFQAVVVVLGVPMVTRKFFR